jgi:hypothetical protein
MRPTAGPETPGLEPACQPVSRQARPVPRPRLLACSHTGTPIPYENGRPHAPDRSRHIALKKPCHLPLKVTHLDNLLTDDSRGLRPQPDTSGLGDAITGQTVAYQRVSSLDQRADRQLDGITVQRTFTDTVSGKDTDRPQLEAMLGFVRGCDTVIVHSMDRLARNLEDLRRMARDLTAKGVRVQFLTEQLTTCVSGPATVQRRQH